MDTIVGALDLQYHHNRRHQHDHGFTYLIRDGHQGGRNIENDQIW